MNLILWTIFCLLDGIVDGFMFSKARDYMNVVIFGIDIHVFLLLRRVVVCLALYTGLIDVLVFALVQAFLHNGAYFEIRKRMDGSYPKGFFTSRTGLGTAKINSYLAAVLMITTPLRGSILAHFFIKD